MESIGWEIRPAGWLLLFVLAVLLIYFIIRWLQRPSENNLGKT